MNNFVAPGKSFICNIEDANHKCIISSTVSDESNKYIITECINMETLESFYGYFLSISGKISDLFFLSKFEEMIYSDKTKVSYRTSDKEIITITTDKKLIRS